MEVSENFLERHGLHRVMNAIGSPTIIGANVVAPEIISVVEQVLRVNVEIDDLQGAASQVISRWTGAEAGCVTSSSSSGLAVTAAAVMTGPDLSKVARLPDTSGMRNEFILQAAHDVNFGARISQMIQLSGARPVLIGTANHCDLFHLRGALTENTAGLFYVENDAVKADGDFLSLQQCVEALQEHGLPVIVDAAAEPDVRPFVKAGASLVIASAHKLMGAPTAGMICGRRDLIRACYLQNWGVGRAMKVGKEGIAGCMAAVERWYSRDKAAENRRFQRLCEIFARHVPVRKTSEPDQIEVEIAADIEMTARQLANRLREGKPPIWVRGARDGTGEHVITIDLRVMSESDAEVIATTIAEYLSDPRPPAEDVPYHDLYRAEKSLLQWPD